jgi:hypothetical protein
MRDGYVRATILKEMIDEIMTCTLHRKITFFHAEIQEQTQEQEHLKRTGAHCMQSRHDNHS